MERVVPGSGTRPVEEGQPAVGEEGLARGRWRRKQRRRGRETWWQQQVQRWRRQGSEAGSSPVAPQVVVVEREGKEEGGGSERARRTRQERGVRTGAREWPALEESQAGGLQKEEEMSIHDFTKSIHHFTTLIGNIFSEMKKKTISLCSEKRWKKRKRKLYHQDWARRE